MNTQLDQANDALQRDDIVLATRLYHDAIQADPKNPFAHEGLAKCLFLSKRYEEAIAECSKALEFDASLEAPHRMLADIYLRKKQFDMYEHELTSILTISPNSPDILAALGQLFLNTKRVEAGVSAFRAAADLEPSNWIAHCGLAAAYVKQSPAPRGL